MVLSEVKTLLIANPAAQRGNGEAAAQRTEQLLREKGIANDLTVVRTEYAGHAIELAAQAGGFDAVIALGGDGIVHEVINGLMRVEAADRPAFGLIPVGSGNDYARTLGMSEGLEEAIMQLAGASESAVDVGVCNGEFFAETLSFGLDAAIALDTVVRRERTGQQGTALYLASGIDQLLHHLDTFAFTATLDGERTIEGSMHMFAVQNGQTYGGGFRICPEARIDDGILDICYALAPMNVVEATYKFLRAKDAHHTHFKNIRFERASSIELCFDRRPPCQIDGEPHIADSYSISVEKQALRALFAN